MDIEFNYCIDRGFVKSIFAKSSFRNLEFEELITLYTQMKTEIVDKTKELNIDFSDLYTRVFLNLDHTNICIIMEKYIRPLQITTEQIEKFGFILL